MPKKSKKKNGTLSFLIFIITALWSIVLFTIIMDFSNNLKWRIFAVLSVIIIILVITGLTTDNHIKKAIKARFS